MVQAHARADRHRNCPYCVDGRSRNCPGGSQAIHRLVAISFVLFFLTGCFQTAQIHTAQRWYYQKRFDAASQYLDLNQIPKRDLLLGLLEKGMALQAGGRYAESVAVWREAEAIMENVDIFHAGEQALSLILDQNILSYQPAPYEPPFLHSLLCLDYLFLRDFPAARVEALKSLQNLEARESIVGSMDFVRYVAALSFECNGDLNDAYIEYKKIHESGVEGFLPTLIRLSSILGIPEDREKYVSELGDTSPDISSRTEPQVSIIFFLGKSPRKVSSEVVLDDGYKIILPVFQTQSNPIRGVRFLASPDGKRSSIALTSVENLAANYSGKLLAGELLKEVLRRKAQEHLLKKVGDKVGSTTETILKTIFFFSKEADLRTWSSLPANVHLLLVPVSSSDRISVEFGSKVSPDYIQPFDTDLAFPTDKTVCKLILRRAW